MAPDDDEEELKKALERGDFITIGPKSVSKLTPSPIPTEKVADKLSVKYFQYNTPIGIDFQKSIDPLLYLSALNLLDLLIQLPLISTEIRYTLESLRNDLAIGHFTDFHHRLFEYININHENLPLIFPLFDPSYNIKQKVTEKPPATPQPTAQDRLEFTDLLNYRLLAFLLGIILNEGGKIVHKWPSIKELDDLISQKDQRKIKLREWASTPSLATKDTFIALIANFIFSFISKNPLAKSETELWLKIRSEIITGDFRAAHQDLASILTKFPKACVDQDVDKLNSKFKHNNNDFSNSGIIGLWALWTSCMASKN